MQGNKWLRKTLAVLLALCLLLSGTAVVADDAPEDNEQQTVVQNTDHTDPDATNASGDVPDNTSEPDADPDAAVGREDEGSSAATSSPVSGEGDASSGQDNNTSQAVQTKKPDAQEQGTSSDPSEDAFSASEAQDDAREAAVMAFSANASDDRENCTHDKVAVYETLANVTYQPKDAKKHEKWVTLKGKTIA